MPMADERDKQLGFEVIPAYAEEAERAKNADRDAQREFNKQFTLEEMPACPVGMEILRAFSVANPGAYQLAQQKRFAPDFHPMFKNVPKWQEFLKHYDGCADCNESGPNYQPYTGTSSNGRAN